MRYQNIIYVAYIMNWETVTGYTCRKTGDGIFFVCNSLNVCG